MTKLTRYLFGNEAALTITTRTLDGQSWYMAARVCDLLEISNHSLAVKDYLDDSEWRKETIYIGGRRGKKHVLLINESGMLKLIAAGRSRSAAQVLEMAKNAPAYINRTDWPAELRIAA